MTWFEAGILTLLRLYVAGVPWAVREVHNRCFGRVPLNVDVAQSSFQVVLTLPDNGRPRRAPEEPDELVLDASSALERSESR